MKILNLILNRIKKPQVIMSILSQVIIILTILNIDVDVDAISGIVTAVCTILVMLGIMSNPDDGSFGYCDEIHVCSNCHKNACHIRVKDKLICRNCGNTTDVCDINEKKGTV